MADKDKKMARGGRLGVMRPLKLKNHAPGMGHVPHMGGLFHGDGGGRTDNLKVSVKPNSFVIPADVVSGLGQGNTTAGGKVLDHIFGQGNKSNPIGKMSAFASGGRVENIPIIVAGGEYHVLPETVKKIGGSFPNGHHVLEKFVEHVRKKTIKEMKKLPGPK